MEINIKEIGKECAIELMNEKDIISIDDISWSSLNAVEPIKEEIWNEIERQLKLKGIKIQE